MANNPLPKHKQRLTLNLYTSGNLNLYEISEQYFRRKLPCKLAEGELGFYYLVASQLIALANLGEFSVISSCGLKRWSRIGSNIVSPVIYRNFGQQVLEVELHLEKLANLKMIEVRLIPDTLLIEIPSTSSYHFTLAPNEAKEFFVIHLAGSFELKILERVKTQLTIT